MKTKKPITRVLIYSIIIATCFVQAVVLSSASNPPGDLNNDGDINMADVMTLARVFNSTRGDALYVESIDLTNDGAINMADVMVLAGNFNKQVIAATSTLKPTPTPVPSVSTTKSITVKKIEKNQGDGTLLRYYVADINLGEKDSLLTAVPSVDATLSKIAIDNNAIFAINGDYFSYRNDGIVIRNGQILRNSPVRDCLIIYKNGLMETAYEKEVSANSLLANGAQQVFSFGPILVKDGVALKTFVRYSTDQGPTYLLQEHPRTGIGMIEPNHFIAIVVDGRTANTGKGIGMGEFANLFAELGCKTAYNLDGGGSAEMYYN